MVELAGLNQGLDTGARRRARIRESAVSLGMMGPAVLLYTLMTVVPVGVAIYLSFTD